MRIAVLGCGPAGLLAVHAVVQAGFRPDILSIKQPSRIMGAQYLHKPIPGLTNGDPDLSIEYLKLGTAEGYAKKAYGDPRHKSSWAIWKPGKRRAWLMRTTYARAWDLYSDMIRDVEVTPELLGQIQGNYDFIFSSIPLPSLCADQRLHRFVSLVSWVTPRDPRHYYENTIIYNGLDGASWHRASNIAGHCFLESAEPIDETSKPVIKPQASACSCWPNVIRVGRYGRWERDILIHDAYEEATKWIRRTG